MKQKNNKKWLMLTTLLFLLAISFLFANKTFAGSATLNWNANTESDLAGYKIYYGTAPRTCANPGLNGANLCGYADSLNVNNITTYDFTNLTDGQTYYFSVSAYDNSGNYSAFSDEKSKVITAAPAADTTAPTISAISAMAINNNTATIFWTTNESSDTQVEYGATASYGLQTTLEVTMAASHSQALSGLTASTPYHYRVKSKDAAGNLAISPDHTFTTAAAAATISDSTKPASGMSATSSPAAPSKPASGTAKTSAPAAQSPEIANYIKSQKKLLVKLDDALARRLKGKILLQAESKGEAWYLDPISLSRFYLPNGAQAYGALRKFGLGITNKDLVKIPVGIERRFLDTDTDGDGLADKLEEGLGTDINKADSDGDSYNDFTEVTNNYNPLGANKLTYDNKLSDRLKGRIVLQVEGRGQAWYINPADGKRYYLKDGEAAYQIMRFLSLGITNANIRKIKIGD